MVQAAFYIHICVCDSDYFYISVYDYQIIAHVQEAYEAIAVVILIGFSFDIATIGSTPYMTSP